METTVSTGNYRFKEHETQGSLLEKSSLGGLHVKIIHD
jgi:hypothetical protein